MSSRGTSGRIPTACRRTTAFFEGNFRETIPIAAADLGPAAILVHADIGTASAQVDAEISAYLGEALMPLLAEGALVISDRHIPFAKVEELPLPDGIDRDQYFVRRVFRV